jgi:hypothetical protein
VRTEDQIHGVMAQTVSVNRYVSTETRQLMRQVTRWVEQRVAVWIAGRRD